MSKHQQINILCIGQKSSGKTTFLEEYTKQNWKEGDYKIFIKRIGQDFVYFHQLEIQQQIYLQQIQFDGILFFLDVVNSINAQFNLLKWIEMYSNVTKLNVHKIPIKVIVMKVQHFSCQDLINQRKTIGKQLLGVIQQTQIIYWQDTDNSHQDLQNYFLMLFRNDIDDIGIRDTLYVTWKLFGIWQSALQIWDEFKSIIFRKGETVLMPPLNVIKRKMLGMKNSYIQIIEKSNQ